MIPFFRQFFLKEMILIIHWYIYIINSITLVCYIHFLSLTLLFVLPSSSGEFPSVSYLLQVCFTVKILNIWTPATWFIRYWYFHVGRIFNIYSLLPFTYNSVILLGRQEIEKEINLNVFLRKVSIDLIQVFAVKACLILTKFFHA